MLQEVTDVFIWNPRGWVNWDVGAVTPEYFGFYIQLTWLEYQERLVKCCEGNNKSYVKEELMTWCIWTYVCWFFKSMKIMVITLCELTLWIREFDNCLQIQRASWYGKMAAMAWKEWDGIPWDKCWYLLISHYALLIVLSSVIKFCTHVIEKSCITCGGNAGDRGNKCGSCERLGNIEDDVLSRGSVCNIPQLVRLLSRNFLSSRFYT